MGSNTFQTKRDCRWKGSVLDYTSTYNYKRHSEVSKAYPIHSNFRQKTNKVSAAVH